MGWLLKSAGEKTLDALLKERGPARVAGYCIDPAGDPAMQKYGLKLLAKAAKDKEKRLEALKGMGRVASDCHHSAEIAPAAMDKFREACTLRDVEAAVKHYQFALLFYMAHCGDKEVLDAAGRAAEDTNSYAGKEMKKITEWSEEGRLEWLAYEAKRVGIFLEGEYCLALLARATQNPATRLEALEQVGRATHSNDGALGVIASETFKAVCSLADEQAAAQGMKVELLGDIRAHAVKTVADAANAHLELLGFPKRAQ